jgi:hypothetical protein
MVSDELEDDWIEAGRLGASRRGREEQKQQNPENAGHEQRGRAIVANLVRR